MQTPATVFLDAHGIGYEVCRYDHDPSAASYGIEAAEQLGLEPELVFKTLVAQLEDDRSSLVVAIVPVDSKLDLKALARAAGTKRARMTTVDAAERSSGYIAGGISPFGQRRKLDTFVDETAEMYDRMYVSGGQRGLDLAVSPSDLITSLNAILAPLSRT